MVLLSQVFRRPCFRDVRTGGIENLSCDDMLARVHRYVEGSALVSEHALRTLGGFNVFVRAPSVCRTLMHGHVCVMALLGL